MASIFLVPALLGLASNEAQSSCDVEEAERDDSRVYGFKPSSLLTNIAIVEGLIATIILPLFGAITDHTPHRRSVGGWSAAGLSIIKIIELALSQKTWFAVSWLQVASSTYFVSIARIYSLLIFSRINQGTDKTITIPDTLFLSHVYKYGFVHARGTNTRNGDGVGGCRNSSMGCISDRFDIYSILFKAPLENFPLSMVIDRPNDFVSIILHSC
mmetsp:Transcript_3354/g.5000  ORF Transcript_3354/g.5000 Transcript_3354/m.5000 type:complete len:214 (-) Transcript_3354:298-939(-)